METLYTYCAAIGAALLLGQLLLSLVGLGEHAGIDGGHGLDFHGGDFDGGHAGGIHADHPDHGGRWFVGILSFRSFVAAATVFGLVGLGMSRQFVPPKPAATLMIALAAGGGVMYAVGWLLRMAYRLRSDGTVHIERTVGVCGSTYLTIPARRAGTGKVTIKVQDRIMEYNAMTSGDEIPTGAPVIVLGILSPQTIEVARPETANERQAEGTHHA
jgi:hypothetical protein